jgi:hypothetical protein
MAARKATEMVPTMIRMRESLRKQLERAAERNDRSLNAEMVDRLERSIRDQEILLKIHYELAGIKEAMIEKQEEQLGRLIKKWWLEDAHQRHQRDRGQINEGETSQSHSHWGMVRGSVMKKEAT